MSGFLPRVGAAAAGIGSFGARHPRARILIQWGIVVLVFGFLAAFLISQWNKLPNYNWRFRPGWLALAVVVVGAFYLAQCELWRVILRALGERLDAPIARSIWGKSILARYVPTSALMVVGRVVLAEREGVSKRTCLASIAYELGLSLSAALIMGSYFVITLPDLAHQPARFGVLVVIPIVLAALHPRVFGPAGSWALRKLGREPLPATLPFPTVLVLIVPYIASYAAIGLGVFAFAEALQPLSFSDLPFVSSSYAVAFCVAVVTFIVPSGLGTRDATLALALDRVLPGAVATAIAVAFRIFQTVIEVLFVGIVVALGRRHAKGVQARPAQPSSA